MEGTYGKERRGEQLMKYSATLLAVRNMDRSLAFYKELFGQEVICDLGWNKTLTCGLVLQLHFDCIADFPAERMQFKSHNMELYFETEDLDAFLEVLATHPEVERLHDVRTHPWQQRVIRIFDPDGHLIEVGESMESVAFREFRKGLSVSETAKIVQHPVELVHRWYEAYQKVLH